MHVGDEAWPAQRLRPQVMQRPNVESLEHRIHGHPLSSPKGETYGFYIDEDEVDLRVRHAECLDDVLDRRSAIKGASEAAFAPCNAQIIVELLVEAKFRSGHELLGRCRTQVCDSLLLRGLCVTALERVAEHQARLRARR